MLQGLHAFLECCQCIICCTRDEPILQQEQYKEMQPYGGEFTIISD